MAGRGNPKTGGRRKGVSNKTTALLKDAVLEAAERAGDKEGMIGYLTDQAIKNPVAFLTLLGKVLPIQAMGAPNEEEPVNITVSFASADQERSPAALDTKAIPLWQNSTTVNEAA